MTGPYVVINPADIRAQAEKEWREEKWRELVNAEKHRIRERAGRSWFARVFPFRIAIVRI